MSHFRKTRDRAFRHTVPYLQSLVGLSDLGYARSHERTTEHLSVWFPKLKLPSQEILNFVFDLSAIGLELVGHLDLDRNSVSLHGLRDHHLGSSRLGDRPPGDRKPTGEGQRPIPGPNSPTSSGHCDPYARGRSSE